MSLIQCTNDCKFQKDGYCNLEKAGRMTNAANEVKSDCLYYQQSERYSAPPNAAKQ